MQTFLFRNFSAGAERGNRTLSIFLSPALATTNSALNAWTEPKSSSNRPGSRFHMNTHPSLARFRFNLELIRVTIQSPLQSSKLYNEVRQCKDETKHPLANFETPYVVHFQNRSERWNEVLFHISNFPGSNWQPHSLSSPSTIPTGRKSLTIQGTLRKHFLL